MATDSSARVTTPGAARAAFDGRSGPAIGCFVNATDLSMPIIEVATEMEDRGFTGLFLNEHPHIPASHPRSQWPGADHGITPERYARFWCPYAALSFVAARTSLVVGPLVSLIGEHDAIALAKTIATIDVLSEGRFILGVGWGWMREEFEQQGFPANVRAKVVEEKLAVMKELWTKEVAEFHGEYINVEPARSWPKPVQKPHPPVFAGLPASSRNFKRIARWADGWVPHKASNLDWGLPPVLGELQHEWAAAGRDKPLRIMVIHRDLSADGLRRAVDRGRELGVERINLRIPDADRNETLRILDAAAAELERIFG